MNSFRRFTLYVAVALLSVAGGRADEFSDETGLPKVEVLSCGNHCANFKPAKRKDRPLPDFPRSVDGPFNPHAEGMVLLTYTIGEDGRVRDASPIYVLGPYAFAAETIETVKSWSFEPATLDGKPVSQTSYFGLTYNATSLVSGTRVDTSDIFKDLANSPSGPKLEEDISKLRELFPNPLINRGQRTMMALALAQDAIRRRDYLDARRLAILGTIWPGASYAMIRTLSLIRITSDLFLGEIADALAVKAEMSEPGNLNSVGSDPETIASAAPVFDLLETGRARFDALPQFNVQAKIPDGPETTVYWHILYRRIFGFHVLSGMLEKFVLGCKGGMIESKITEMAQWQIPKSWSDCRIYVYGAPGAKFNLIEASDDFGQQNVR